MMYLDLADQIIPGYKALSKKQRKLFEASEPGRQMSQVINDTLDAMENFSKSHGLMSFLLGTSEKNREQLKERFAEDKEKLLNNINQSPEYQTIIVELTKCCLKKEFKDFNLLTQEEQIKLASTDVSKALRLSLIELDKLIEAEDKEFATLDDWAKMNNRFNWQQSIKELEINKKDVILAWETVCLAENGELEPFMKSIAEQKELIKTKKAVKEQKRLERHLNELASFFPLLHRQKTMEELSIIEQLLAISRPNDTSSDCPQSPTYRGLSAVSIKALDAADKPRHVERGMKCQHALVQLEKEHLSNLLLFFMQEANKVEMNFINLDVFNKEQATLMAQKILTAFYDQTNLQVEKLFEDYKNCLYKHVIKELRLINGKEWTVNRPGASQELMNSLSYLWNNPATERVNAYMAQLSDAHAFIQATNFSTQNESSLLAILDLYNYGRYTEQISETKNIIVNLLKPLLPLYDEYKQIAFYEKNIYLKTFRILMPITIVSGVIVGSSAILAPLILEIAFLAAFVPSLIVGLALAVAYVSVKNDVYRYYRDRYYGGSFEIPEFQINERMDEAFGHENAKQIRLFYINAIKECDNQEAGYCSLYAQGRLKQEQIKERNDNLIKRHRLYLEWYDIHSNYDLGVDKLKSMILTRLQQDTDSEYRLLETTLAGEKGTIKDSLDKLASDIKTNIVMNSEELKVEEQKDVGATLIKTSYRHGLFKSPQTLAIKKRVEEMLTLSEQLAFVA